MRYELVDGKRVYRDSKGRVIIDNVSQKEADRRERRNIDETASTRHTVTWGVIILLAMILTVTGALVYNQAQESSAESAIESYMENE